MNENGKGQTGNWIANVALLAGGLLVTILFLEVGGRLLRRPCNNCWGTILGMELPPFRVLSDSDFVPTPLDTPFDSLVVDGRRITVGDLWGVYREDSLLGFAPLENARSKNGWYVTNSIGARSTVEYDSTKADSVLRVLAFGDSFGAGSRVREFETWSTMLDEHDPGIEVVNFAVDGYSLAQAYLRYVGLKTALDHDRVVVLFPPSATQWREISTFRNLRDWRMPLPVPRFLFDESGSYVVQSPYATIEEVRAANQSGVNEEFRDYLRRNDAFYLRSKYESPPIIGGLVTYKIAARIAFRVREIRLRARFRSFEGDAMRVSRYILDTWARDVQQSGRELVIVYTPLQAEVMRYRDQEKFRNAWDRLTEYPCPNGAHCIDLMDAFQSRPDTENDLGYDGTHYGPRGNAVIADVLRGYFRGIEPGR